MAMVDNPRVVQTNAVQVAAIHLVIPRAEIRSVMGPGLEELMAALRAQDIPPAGPWLTHHLRMDPATFDFEICVPVGRRVAAAGRVRPGELPATTVARTVYPGDYEGLGKAWQEFEAWIRAQGRKPGPSLWEVYLTDPATSPDPSAWRTELNWPLVG